MEIRKPVFRPEVIAGRLSRVVFYMYLSSLPSFPSIPPSLEFLHMVPCLRTASPTLILCMEAGLVGSSTWNASLMLIV